MPSILGEVHIFFRPERRLRYLMAVQRRFGCVHLGRDLYLTKYYSM